MEARVAVTGIGIIINNIIKYEQLQNLYSPNIIKTIHQIPEIDSISKREMRRLSNQTCYALHAAVNAYSMAGKPDTKNTGIFFTLTHSSTTLLCEFHDYLIKFGPRMASPNAFSNSVTNAPLAAVSNFLKIKKGGITLVSNKPGGLDALNTAANAILNNEYSNCIVGSSEEYSEIVESAYNKCGLYKNNKPDYLPYPQSKYVYGVPISEGSVFIMLESIENLEFKKIKPLCYIIPENHISDHNYNTIISGAAAGPQDKHELVQLKKLTQNNNISNIIFPKIFFGESFALSPLLSVAMGISILNNKMDIPQYQLNKELGISSNKSTKTKNILITASTANGYSSILKLNKQ